MRIPKTKFGGVLSWGGQRQIYFGVACLLLVGIGCGFPCYIHFLRVVDKAKNFAFSVRALDSSVGLFLDSAEGADSSADACGSDDAQNQRREIFRRNEATEVGWRFIGILVGFVGGICLLCYIEGIYVDRVHVNRLSLWGLRITGWLLVFGGFCCGFLPIYWDYDATYGCNQQKVSHSQNTLRCTPAMEAGIERDFWTVENRCPADARL